MMIIRDHLIRHPDRCTHQAVCVPICPTGAWLSTPPYKFDAARCLESCRLCLDACPSQAIYGGVQEGGEAAGAAAEEIAARSTTYLPPIWLRSIPTAGHGLLSDRAFFMAST